MSDYPAESLVFTYVPAKIELTSAPDEAKISLAAFQQAPAELMRFEDGYLVVGQYPQEAVYEVVGFDRYDLVLEVRKVSG